MYNQNSNEPWAIVRLISPMQWVVITRYRSRAENNGEKIAVEVKSFIGASAISDFHTAIGQFINYRLALEEQEPERILYLAVPLVIHQTFFSLQFIQIVIVRCQIKLIVYDPVNEVIVQWKK